MQKEIRFSFIIPCADRLESLGKCIYSIENAYEKAGKPEIEILVVFNGGQKGSWVIPERCREFTKLFYVEGTGLSLARNFGINQSKGEFLVFLDDDAMVKDDFLIKLDESVTEYNQVGAFCGRLIDPQSNIPFSSCYNLKENKFLGWADFQLFRGSAIILRRPVTRGIGLFDEDFGSGARFYGAEDSDMFFRIKQRGLKVRYLADVVFYHDILLNPPASKVFNYSYSIGAMLVKQVLKDFMHGYFYIGIMLNALIKNLLRMIQNKFFPGSLGNKNTQFKYTSAFWGMLAGINGFLKKR